MNTKTKKLKRQFRQAGSDESLRAWVRKRMKSCELSARWAAIKGLRA